MDFFLQAGVLLCKIMNKKICIKCGNVFKKKITVSKGSWKKAKYCSNNCRLVRHGMFIGGKKATTEYVIWNGMKQRCLNEKESSFINYGGRGIKICKEWDSFERFYKDMGKRPAGKSIDRIDNDGDYCKKNCKWSTDKEQANNTRRNTKNKKVLYNGIEYSKDEIIDKLSDEFGIKKYILISEIKDKDYNVDKTLNKIMRRKEILEEKKIGKLKSIKYFDNNYSKRNNLIVKFRLDKKTLEEIGNNFGLTKQRIKQILNDIENFDKKEKLFYNVSNKTKI